MAMKTRKCPSDLHAGDAVQLFGMVAIVQKVERIRRRGGLDCWLIETPTASFHMEDDETIEVDETTPGRYDGYMSETEAGWEVSSGGRVIGVYADEAIAATIVARGKQPSWKVAADGTVTRLG